MKFSTWSLSPLACRINTPAKAAGTEPRQSHRTSSQRTVLRRMCTPAPTGFIATAATRSEETAAVGVILKKITRMGVMSAPPPMPVSPTVNPTISEASAIFHSIIVRCSYVGGGRGRPRPHRYQTGSDRQPTRRAGHFSIGQNPA